MYWFCVFFSLVRPLPGFKPTPRDMAHRRWDVPAGWLCSYSGLFICLWQPLRLTMSLVWTHRRKQKFTKRYIRVFTQENCYFVTVVLWMLWSWAQKAKGDLWVSGAEETGFSDATHSLLGRITRIEALENTVQTLLTLFMSYFGQVGTSRLW